MYIFGLRDNSFSGSGAAFQAFLVWGWGIFFSVTLIAFSLAMPSWILNNLPFMRSFLGRGLIISLGACLTSGWCHSFCFQMVVFLYCIILAVAYVIMDLALKMTPTQAPLAPGLGGDMTPPSVPSAPSGGNRLPPSSAPKLNYGPLPDGWTSSIDPKSGQVYYVHKSGVSQWTRP